MAVLQKLPNPTWYGFEADCLRKFTAFVAEDRLRRSSIEPERLRAEIAEVETLISETTGYLRNETTDLRKAEADLRELNAVFDNLADESLQKKIDDLQKLPFVVKVRMDRDKSNLVIVIRLFTWRLLTRDLGDIALTLFTSDYRNGFSIRLVRRSAGNPVAAMEKEYSGYSSRAVVNFDKNDDKLLGQGDIVALIKLVRRYVLMSSFWHAWKYPVVWSRKFPKKELKGATRVNEIFAQAVRSAKSDIRVRMRRAESAIASSTHRIETYRESLRGYNTRLRLARAALVKCKNEVNNIVVNVEEVAAMLRSIFALPGMMGLRFTESGIPVFHVRSSHIYKGKRYDLGDYEMRLKQHEETASVLNIYATRGGSSLYYQGDESDPGGAWFCFGARVDDLQRLFRAGDFGSFMNLAVNSLNGINKHDRDVEYLSEEFNEIPLTLVWKAPRRRPRRRPRIPVQEKVAV